MTTDAAVAPSSLTSGTTVWVARVLAAFVILATMAAVLTQVFVLKGPPHLSLTALKVGDEYVVVSVAPGGIAWDAGVRLDARLKDVVGGILEEGSSGTLVVNPTEAMLTGVSPATRVTAQRNATLVAVEGAKEALWMLGLLFAVSAAVVLLVRSWDQTAWALSMFLVSAGLVLSLSPAADTQGIPVLHAISGAGMLLAATGFAWFCSVFPDRARFTQLRDCCTLWVALVMTGGTYGVVLWGLLSVSEAYNYGRIAIGLLVAVVAVAGIVQVVMRYRKTVPGIRRVQLMLLIGAFTLGLGPVALLVVLPLAVGISPGRLPMELSISAMSIVPLGLVYSVTQYQWRRFRLPGRVAMPGVVLYACFVVGCFLALIVGPYFSAHGGIDRTGVLVLGAIAATTACFGLGFRKVLTALQQSGDEKREMTQEFVRRREERIREDERRRLASDLHDGPIQSLTAALLFLGAKPTAPPQALQALERATKELRTMVQFGTLPEVSGNLVKAVEGLSESIEDLSHIAVACSIRGGEFIEALPPEKKAELYRIVHEALANVVRHSRAREVVVRLNGDAKSVALVVRDNGIGFDLGNLEGITSGHFGLAGIRSRVECMSGACEIWSKPGTGTIIKVSIPTG